MSKKVAIIMGSDSDLPVVKAAISELKAFGVPSEVHVMSAHRTPGTGRRICNQCKGKRIRCDHRCCRKGCSFGWCHCWVIPPYRSSAFRSSPLHWTDWMPCWQPYRCRLVFRLQPLRLTGLQMQQFLLFRCWLFPMMHWQNSWYSGRRPWQKAL